MTWTEWCEACKAIDAKAWHENTRDLCRNDAALLYATFEQGFTPREFMRSLNNRHRQA